MPHRPATPRGQGKLATALGVLALCLLFLVGLGLRMDAMTPVAQGLTYQPDYDEGVNTAAGQLWRQGLVPYRDYFFAHPPLAVLLFGMVAQAHFVPWGDATTFMFARYASIGCGLLTLLVVFAIGRKVGGTASGLLAMGVLAIDAVVVEIDRRAMLSSAVNLLGALAILAFVYAVDARRRQPQLMAGAGALGACCMLVKLTGALGLGAMFAFALARCALAKGPQRHVWLRHGGALLAGAVGVILPVVGYAMMVAPNDFFRQVVLFQLGRPPDGVPAVTSRIAELWNPEGARLTLWLAGAGGVVIALRGALAGGWGHWPLLALWSFLVAGFLAVTRVYYYHYFVQLAVPLSLWAGALVSHAPKPPTSLRPRICQIVGLAVAWAGTLMILPGQLEAARAVARSRSTALRDVGEFLKKHTDPKVAPLAFDPTYGLVASRPPPRLEDGSVLIDSYGYLMFLNLGLADGEAHRSTAKDTATLLRGERGQRMLLQLAQRSDFVIIDSRAVMELSAQSRAILGQRFTTAYRTNGAVVVSRITAEGARLE
jgi:hypothetical protein